jgi:hypothetical protein
VRCPGKKPFGKNSRGIRITGGIPPHHDQNKKVITITGIFSYVVFSHAGFSAYGKLDKTIKKPLKNITSELHT